MPDWGRDTRTGGVVHSSKADRDRVYVCPVCRLRLELRRGSELEYFAHWRGLEGTRDCDLFSPDDGGRAQPSPSPQGQSGVGVRRDARAEDDPFEAGLLVDLSDGRWSVGLRLPELRGEELGALSLADLRPASVEILIGQATKRVSALELLSADGAARVLVPPDVDPYRTKPSGTWPAAVETKRWQGEVRGLEPKGTLFRLSRGDWTRLSAGSGVHLGESLLLVAEARFPPPAESVRSHDIVNAGRTWRLWELSLTDRSAAWLSELGYPVVPRRWSVAQATAPRGYTDRREPVYWIGDGENQDSCRMKFQAADRWSAIRSDLV